MADEADLLIEAGFSDAKLARESAKVIDMFKQTGAKAEKAFQSAVDSVSGSQKVKATAREIEKLRREFDPLYAASKRYEAQLTKLNRAHEAGAISAKQHAAALDRLNGEFSGGTTQAAEAGRKFGGSLQQVGFQIGDFATQVGAGTSATQAMGQQLPQLLGAFGTFGALAGAAAAVMIPLGSALLKAAFDSETLEERMKTLSASTDAMQEAAKLAATPIGELREKYGDLADEVARANGAMAAFTAAQAGAQLKGAAGATASLFPDAALPTRIYGMSDSEWAAVTEGQMRKLMKATGATKEQAEELAMALRRLESTNGPEAVVRDAENLLSVMERLPDSTTRLAPQFEAIKGLMKQAQAQIEAQRAEVVRLREEYDATTAKMRQLAADLSRAEAERAKASAAGKTEEVAQWDRVIAKIREMVYETRAAASETDTLFERMTKGAQGFLDRAGKFANGYVSPEGFESRYIEERARGAGSKNEEAVRAATAAAEQLGVAAKDLLAVMSFESGINPGRWGGAGGKYLGLIQFSPENQRRYGVNENQSIAQQMGAVVKYLKDTGVKPGMGIEHIYAAILAGDARRINASDRKNGGIVDNVYADTHSEKYRLHINKAEGLLAAYPDIAKAASEAAKSQETFADTLANSSRTLGENAADLGKSAEEAAYLAKKNELVNAAVKAGIDPATQMAEIERQAQVAGVNARLAEEIKLREKNSEAMKRMGEQLAANLVDQKKEAELAAWAAQQTAQINASGMGEQQKAAALAAVTAEVEKQRLVYKLLAEAKAQNVDVDAVMDQSLQAQIAAVTGLTAGAITYRQAIEALGAARGQQAVADQQAAAAADRLKQSQEFAAQQTQALKDGIVDAILAGGDFADVLSNVARALAKAALQAALFGDGPVAGGALGGYSGGGALSGLFSRLFGGARAAGGPVNSGRAYLVGERGPEIIVPRSAGQVIPNHRLGGSTTFAPQTSIVVQGSADRETLAILNRELARRDARFIADWRRAHAEVTARAGR